MKIDLIRPPREFRVGGDDGLVIRHCANVELAPDEQVTFVSPADTQYDVVRKVWGYYATPSVNRRLRRFGLRAGLCENRDGARYVVLVEEGREREFYAYLDDQDMVVLSWLDAGAAAVPPGRE